MNGIEHTPTNSELLQATDELLSLEHVSGLKCFLNLGNSSIWLELEMLNGYQIIGYRSQQPPQTVQHLEQKLAVEVGIFVELFGLLEAVKASKKNVRFEA